jgi:hypothetical protein
MATFDVLLPVKNGITFLAEAIDSIISQTFKDWRLIVLDHGSTDGSVELAQNYAERDARVIVRVFPEASGLSGLLNSGLDLCDCKYILRQDADDISLPDRMAVLAKAFEEDPTLVVLGSLGDIIDVHGERIGNIDMPTGPQGVAALALFRTPICHPAAAMRFDAMQSLGRANGPEVRYGVDFIGAMPSTRRITVTGLAEDYFLFGQLALIAPCRNIAQPLIKYRWHSTNVGATKHIEQMQMALDISRYLAETFSILNDVEYIDPAPFCNHGESLFDIDAQTDFSEDYASLSEAFCKALPPSDDLNRELAFRKVISDRSWFSMGIRFAAFALSHRIRSAEMNTVRSWMLRGLKRRPMLQLRSGGVISR